MTLAPPFTPDDERSYRATVEGAGVLALAGEGVVRVHGKDARPFLHRMMSAHVEALAPGEGRRGLFLNVKGHIEADAVALVTAEDDVIVTTPARELVATKLEKYLVMDEATVEDLSSALSVVTVQGPRSADAITHAFGTDVAKLARELDHVEANGARIVRRDRTGLGGFDVIGAPISGEPLTPAALDALRIEAGLPLLGRDFGDEQLPQEARLLELMDVAIDKCYVGQEVVSRLHFRGHANRLLVLVELDAPVEPGAKLERDAKDVGKITSAAVSPRRGPIALGYVRREHASPATELVAIAPSGARARAKVVALPWLKTS